MKEPESVPAIMTFLPPGPIIQLISRILYSIINQLNTIIDMTNIRQAAATSTVAS